MCRAAYRCCCETTGIADSWMMVFISQTILYAQSLPLQIFGNTFTLHKAKTSPLWPFYYDCKKLYGINKDRAKYFMNGIIPHVHGAKIEISNSIIFQGREKCLYIEYVQQCPLVWRNLRYKYAVDYQSVGSCALKDIIGRRKITMICDFKSCRFNKWCKSS